MNKYTNLLLISTLLSSISTVNAATTVVDNMPIYEGAFDVSQKSYNDGLNYDYSGSGSTEMWSNSGDVRAFLNAYQTYSDEMERMFEWEEFKAAKRVACPLNQDLTDNKAYMVVKDTRINIKDANTGRISFYQMADIIAGSDWNNNGKLDVFENADGYRMFVTKSACDISY